MTTTSYNDSYNYTFPDESITGDDAAWVLSCGFLILTMQTGFAMLECGCVSSKNVANIMIKNVVDISLGGITYWIFGYGISFGKPSNAFMGMGGWFFQHKDSHSMGSEYTHYFFQLSFATTATTIVSGAVAERMKLHAYMIFSLVNTVVYCFPASWAWNGPGFLRNLGFYDFAGVCVVHLCGGTSALVSVLMLGSRHLRFQNPERFEMSSPVTALTGMFMLIWAWLSFNCGSTFGVSDNKWKISALVAATTINGAIGGGIAGLTFSFLRNKGKIIVGDAINATLGGLVGVTGGACCVSTYEALIIGVCAGFVAMGVQELMVRIQLDDPVGAIPVHFGAAFFGSISVGLFGEITKKRGADLGAFEFKGLFHGGGFRMLGNQLLGIICIGGWSGGITFLFLLIIKKFFGGIRVTLEDELLGADYCEHDLVTEKRIERIELALRTVPQDKIEEVMTKLMREIMLKPKHNLEAGHRIFNKRKSLWDSNVHDVTGEY